MTKNGRLTTILLCAGLMAICMAGCGTGSAGDNTESDIRTDEVDSADKAVPTGVENTETRSVETDEISGGGHPDEEMDNQASLEGFSLSILGDSISTFDGWIPEGFTVFYPFDGEVTDVSQTWWMQLLDDTGMELCSNNSSAGSTCVGDSLSVDDPLYGCSGLRMSLLNGEQGRMPDIIIIFMGTNDLLNDVPIGDNDGTELVEEGVIGNFSDAYCLMLDKLASDYPVAQIYCCTLLPVGDWGTPGQPFVTFVNRLGLTSEDYSRQIQVIAESKGVPVIDLYHCGIEIDNLDVMTTDGAHPTPEGMKCVEQAVLNCIRETPPL